MTDRGRNGESVLVSFCETLRDECAEVWQRLHEHRFIRELAAGTLAPERFRFYVEQDLFFLPELARAVALGAAHAEGELELRHLAEELGVVVGREYENQRELLERVLLLGAGDRGGADEPAPATVAYAGFMVATASRGGPLDVMTAVLPCTWSYADIATALESEVAEHPVYAEWVRFFSSPEYVRLIADRRGALDRLAEGLPEARRRRLSEVFTTSTRLELAFWDMAYGLTHWPDRKEAA